MATSDACCIRNAHIVTPSGIVTGELSLANGVIRRVGGRVRGAPGETVDADGLYALPGFVDIHVHGGRGFDATMGVYNAADDTFDGSAAAFEQGIPRALAGLAEAGTTTALLTTLAAPDQRLRLGLSRLGEYAASARNGRDGARLFGLFIEGTFLKDPRFAGAQNPDHFRTPAIAAFDRLAGAARGAIRYVNIAPEHGAGAFALMDALRERGVLIGAGHTACTGDEYRQAVAHGLRVAVHFTNGPTGSSYKPFHGGGATEAVLRSPEVYAELICDGYHVNPAYVLDVIRRKGTDRIILVTDAMFATGLSGLQTFSVSGVRGEVSADGRYLQCEKPGVLFGSVLRMDVAFGNVLSWLTKDHPGVWNERHPALPRDEAILRASRMASGNAAAVLGCDRSRRGGIRRAQCFGAIEEGKRGDVALAEITGRPGAYRCRVRRVWVGGRRVGGQ